MTAPALRRRGLDAIVSMLTIFARLAAGLVVGGSALKAAVDVSTTWDVWYYHLPFAARIAGVVTRESYVFRAVNEARFAGYPLLAEALQGALWRATGRPESANLLGVGSVVAFVAFLRARFGVPWWAAVLSLYAIPLVMTHAPSAYVDLPANVALAVLVLEVFAAHDGVRARDARHLITAGVAAAIAANMRFQLVPLVFVALVALAPRASALRSPRGLAVGALALLVIFMWPLKNLVIHGNPVFPVRLALGPLVLPHAETSEEYGPSYLAGLPRPAQFAASLLELGARPISEPLRWTVDQYMPDERGNRMGGFFHAYVVASVAALAWLARGGRGRVAACVMFALTVLVAFMPHAHELRYYLAWMLVLVALVLALATRAGPGALGTWTGVSLAAGAVVVWSTGAWHVVPSFYSFAQLARDKVEPARVSGLRDGDRVCLLHDPWTFLYAAPLRGGARYVVREGAEEECGTPTSPTD